MNRRGAAAAGLMLAAVLGGCASRPPAGEAWTSGRLALRVDAGAERAASAFSADFDLRGDDVQGELRLSSTIGTRIAQARWSASEALLDTGRGEQRYDDLESLSRDALGEVLPLRALPSWLAGRPWDRAPHEARAGGFDQLGWSVNLAGRAEGRIDAVRSAPPRVVVRVQLERP
ncbi:MAG: lipoprotein insertase outer membrane protein LolB [Rubrivivax sp.]